MISFQLPAARVHLEDGVIQGKAYEDTGSEKIFFHVGIMI